MFIFAPLLVTVTHIDALVLFQSFGIAVALVLMILVISRHPDTEAISVHVRDVFTAIISLLNAVSHVLLRVFATRVGLRL
ncbi:hypothetical protein [Sulfoacidibacillus ferrooxidans]|nr:hypothetical protein [Sulfoacidibacillus ferrooxidans]